MAAVITNENMVINLSPRVLEVIPAIRTDLVLALLFIVSLLAGVWRSSWTLCKKMFYIIQYCYVLSKF